MVITDENAPLILVFRSYLGWLISTDLYRVCCWYRCSGLVPDSCVSALVLILKAALPAWARYSFLAVALSVLPVRVGSIQQIFGCPGPERTAVSWWCGGPGEIIHASHWEYWFLISWCSWIQSSAVAGKYSSKPGVWLINAQMPVRLIAKGNDKFDLRLTPRRKILLNTFDALCINGPLMFLRSINMITYRWLILGFPLITLSQLDCFPMEWRFQISTKAKASCLIIGI